MLTMWTQAMVSTWSDDGDLHATRYNEAAVSIVGGETADCGRGIGRGSIGGTGCTGARSQRQPGLQLVQAVSGGATAAPERGQTVAGARRWGEFHSAASFMVCTWWFARLLGGDDSHPTAACAGAGRKRCQPSFVTCVVGVSTAMISLPSHTKIWIAAGVTDLRRGFTGLSALVQTKLEQNPLSGQVFIFRGRRGDLVKLIWFDGDGLCLLAKRLERGRFVWPQATEGSVSLTRAQLSMLLEGIDWRRPERTWDPQLAV